MNRGTNRQPALGLVLAAALLAPAVALAQIPGENVNMVTGTQWPGGDPFLQRQNEPSLAVSSANPQHLLAGANDYRSVDVPYPLDLATAKMPGDAWLGVFKSMNGGQTWQSVLMPGFPQDNSTLPSQGASSPLRNCVKGSTALADRCTSAADPVVRAGTDGMLYYSGIAFKRGTSWGKVFLSRFIDLNNKENGDPTRTDPNDVRKAAPTDPIRFVDQVVVASSDGQSFLDKPWIAVDKPRLLAQTCKVTATNPDGTTTTRAFPGGAIYMAWIKFAPGEVTSDVMFSSSRDCGKTWTAAIKLNDATTSLNQAPTIAIDPFTGFVYVAWRRIAYPAKPAVPTQKDAIVVARSFRGFLFTKPRVIAEFTPFEQGSTGTMFRTHAFPSIAISVDKTGYNGWVHVAWSQRMPPFGDSRVVMSTAPVLPPPLNGLESGDPCNGWSVPMPVDDHSLSVETRDAAGSTWRTFTRGHQLMPTLTFSQGKLVVVYYDSRLTHTAEVFQPNEPFLPDPMTGSFYRTERVPIAPWDPRTAGGEPEPPANLFRASNDELDDSKFTNVRHTLEVRVGTSPPGKDPVFSSVQISKYRFGERGDEPPYFKVPRLLGTDSASATVTSRADGLQITDDRNFLRLQQFDVNPPNLPLFKNGTVPFIGDYIDVQGPAFVRKSTGWAFATDPTPAPVFHAVWTTNQDVRPPVDGDWTHYTPMKLPGQSGAIFDGAAASTAATFCTPGTPANEGTRNQNIYTARITEGLLVDSPQNVKPLSSSQTRSFVVVARNDTAYPKAFRFSFTGVAPASCAVAPGQAGPTSCATFSADGSVPAVDVEILPHSSATRSLFVRSGTVATTITVNVNEVVRPGPTAPQCSLAALTCAYVPGGLSGFVTLNPPGSSPSLVPPDGSATGAGTNETITFANVSTANVSTANVSTANVSTANVSTANISTANVSTANVCTANVSTANVSTANVCTANVSTANVSTANVSTANVSTANVTTANISTANVSTANVSTANVSTAPVSDLNYEVTNTSNTTTTYSVQFVCSDPAGCPTQDPLHLMVNKFYVVPASVGCQLVAEPRAVLVANGGYVQDAFVTPDSLIDPKTREGAASNATVSLAPGEKAQITLRGRVSLAEMAAIGTKLVPAVVPHSTPRGGSVGGTQTYATTGTFGLPSVSTQTTLTASGNTYTATVVAVPATAGIPTGKVTFIANGGTLVGVGPLDVAGKAVLTATLPAGTTLVAYYGGDSRFKASSGSIGQKLATALDILIDATPPSAPGQSVTISFNLTAPAASPAPTGGVQLYDGDYRIGSPVAFTCFTGGGVQDCQGFFSVTPSPGNHSFWADYPGDAGYLGSGTGTLAWSVSNATVTVAPPATAPLIGQPATFTASVVNAASQAVTWNVTPAGASISPLGVFVASAPNTYTVTATSAVDPAASGSAAITIAAPTISVSPGGPTTIGMLTTETLLLGATVTGIASPVVNWTVTPATAGVSVTPSADTLSATFAASVVGTYVVTASVGGVSTTATISVSLPVTPSPFGISGAVNDGLVNVAVNRDSATYNDATVSVTGAGGVSYPVPRVGDGTYRTSTYTLPAVGQTVTVTVSGSGQTATATAVVPERPVITAPAQDAVLLAANPITVTWTSATSPDDYAFDGWCGNGQCVAGAWTTVPGTDRTVTFPGGFFPSGQTVSMGLYAYNRMALSGDALPSSSLIVNNRAPTPSTWRTFLVTETTTGTLLRARENHVAVVLNGSVYSIGGNSVGNTPVASVERYDPATRVSTLVASMSEPRSGHGAVVVNGKIYAFGGSNGKPNTPYTASAEVYDPAANTWTPIASMPVARFNIRGAAIGNRIYALGGFSDTGLHDRVDAYDVGTGTWSFLGYLATSRTSFALGSDGTRLYAIGGYASVSPQGPVGTMEVFAGSAPGTLVPGPSTQVPWGPSAASANGAIYVVGGSNGSVLQILDPVARTFSAPPSGWVGGAGAPLYANPVSYAGTATDGSRLFVTGGWPNAATVPTTTITDVPLPALVTVSPVTVSMTSGQTQAFTASVLGAPSQDVAWTASGGLISPTGVFTPPYAGGTITVTATSASVPSASGSATVTVAPPTPVTLTVSPNPTSFEGAVVASLRFAAPLSGPPGTGTVTFADQLRTATGGATAFAPVTAPVACRPQLQAVGLPMICSATATLPAWTIAGRHTVVGAYSGDASFSQGIATVDVDVEIPVPVLEFTGTSARAGGNDYNLRISNWTQYPVEAFASQTVKACGLNNNASRTWVDILDGTTGAYVYGFCAFSAPTNLQGLWFHVPAGSSPPASVKVRATDWIRNVVVESAPVTLPAPVVVTVDPPSASLVAGASMQFVAIVGGTSNTAVTWSVQESVGGTVSSTGSYVAPATAGTYHVVATSVADPTVSGSATVTVTVPAPPTIPTEVFSSLVPSEAGLGATVTLTAAVTPLTPGASPPGGLVTFREASSGAILGTAAPTRACGTGTFCADLAVQTDAQGLGIPVATDASTWWEIRAAYDGDGAYAASSELAGPTLYVYRKGQWHSLAGYGSWNVGAAASGARIYAFGGSLQSGARDDGIWEYDPTTDSTASIGTLPKGSGRAVATGADGRAYVFADGTFVQVFDPATRTVDVLQATGPWDQRDGSAVGLPDGRILYVGGINSDGMMLSNAEAFDPSTGTWSGIASMPTARSGLSAAYAGGKVYVAGGIDDTGARLATVEIYDVASNTWSSGPSMAVPRAYAGMAASGGRVHVVGGEGQAGSFGSTETLDTSSGASWVAGPALLEGRTGAAAVLLPWNGAIYVVGGKNAAGSTRIDSEVLYP
ncbi:MAG TPA: kelch repeat-containing protein [Anaeromyxobacteraceae bacterium]|nr:kelch repeat-containing protein [Anaeromyxobacteraceae bacterium]